jgi:hypothetical protein
VKALRDTANPLPAISKRALCLLSVLLTLAVWAPRASCQSASAPVPQPSLSLRQYISELDRCSAVLNNPASNTAAFHDLRTTLPENWNVTVGENQYSVATVWLAGALETIENNPGASHDALAQLQQRLQTYHDAALAMESHAAAQNLAQSRSQLNSILSAREFRGQHGPTWVDALKSRFWSWVERQWDRLFGPVRRAKGIGNLVAWTVVVLACLLLLFWTVRFLMRTGLPSDLDLSGATPLNRDWHRWLRDARAAAARGDYRAAIHGAYWAAIVWMEETKALPEDRSRTPRESLRLIRRESAEYPPLLHLTRRFELVWYGYRSATATDWSDAVQQLETLGCLRSSTPATSGS